MKVLEGALTLMFVGQPAKPMHKLAKLSVVGAFALMGAGASTLSYANLISIGLAGNCGGCSITTVAGPSNGTASFSGSFGVFDGITVNATGSPTLAQGNLDSTATASQLGTSQGFTLQIFVTEQGIVGPVGIHSIFKVTNFGHASTVTEKTWVDPGNGLYGSALSGTAVLLASHTFAANGTTIVTNNPPALGTYSETLEYDITFLPGQGSFGGEVDIPEPQTLALLGLGLLLLAARREKTAA